MTINVKVPEVAKLNTVVAEFAARVCELTVPPTNALPSIDWIVTEDERFNVRRFSEAIFERKLYRLPCESVRFWTNSYWTTGAVASEVARRFKTYWAISESKLGLVLL